MLDSDYGCSYAKIERDLSGKKWLHVYEASYPNHALLLMAVTNILVWKHVKRFVMPLFITNKMDYIRVQHYNFLKGLRNVESIVMVSLKSNQFDKTRMIRNLPDVCNGDGLISVICREYINLPVFDTLANKYQRCPSAPPLGVITRCLNHLIYQNLLDDKLVERFPGIIFSRWVDEVIIVNKFDSLMMHDKESIENLLKELKLEGETYELLVPDGDRYYEVNRIDCKESNMGIGLTFDGDVSVHSLPEDSD